MQQRRRLLFVALGVAVLAFGLVGTAMALSSHDKVARHVTLVGHNIAGMSRTELTAEVKRIDTDMRKASVHVEAQVRYEDGRTGKISADLQIADAKTFTPAAAKRAA